MLFAPVSTLAKQRYVIDISRTTTNVDLLAYARAAGYDSIQQCIVEINVLKDVVIGSNTITSFALTIEGFPADCELFVNNYGYIVGHGGDSGGGGTSYCAPGPLGTDGGPAIKVRYPVTITNYGIIGGGGAGGAGQIGGGDYYGHIPPGGSGGGGAGYPAGKSRGPYPGHDGSLTKGGLGSVGETGFGTLAASGGDLGEDSKSWPPFRGVRDNDTKRAGNAIDGISYVTLIGNPVLGRTT